MSVTRRPVAAMSRRIAVALAVLLCGLLPLAAQADEASDRRRAISDAESLLKDMARSLSGLARDSGSRGVDDALRSAGRLESKLRDLDRVEGNDSKAREMTSRWPRHIDNFERVKRPLQTLKKGQRSLKRFPRECSDLERELKQAVERALKARKPESERGLRDKAKALGRKGARKLSDAKRMARDMERARSDAKRFSASSGGWRDVKSNVHRAADRMFSDWKKDFEAGRRACEGLKKGARHPTVSRALDTLKRAAGERKQRTALIGKAEASLAQVARATKGLAAARDTRPVDQARNALRDLQSPLRALDKVKGRDARARTLADGWPKAAKGMEAALKALAAMKAQQFGLDEQPDVCAKRQNQLLAVAKAAAAKPAEASHAALLKAASEAGKASAGTLKRADEAAKAVKRAEGTVGRFSPSGDWQPIARQLQGAAKAMARHHADKHRATKDACAELAKGPKHGAIERASSEIRNVLQRVDRLFKAMDAEVKTLAEQIRSAGKASGARSVVSAQGTAKSIESGLKALKGDPDPRAKARSAAWLAPFGALKTALAGLQTLKGKQGQLADAVAGCRAAEAELKKGAGAVATSADLGRLEGAAKTHGKTAKAGLSRGETLARALKKAADQAKSYTFADGPWRGVSKALKGAAEVSISAFDTQVTALKSSCGPIERGDAHPAVKAASVAFGRKVLAAEKTAKGAEQHAERTCAALKPLLVKRARREAAVNLMVAQSLKEREKADPTAARNLTALDWSVNKLSEEIDEVGGACDAAMVAYIVADTALEALHDR